MARPIQRGKKKRDTKPKPPTKTKDIVNVGENQNVQQVTIKIEHPEPPKPKRRKPRKKKDTKKDEAIEELKQELEQYDEVQTQAQQLGIELPAELGVSPSEASALKSSEDIFRFIEVIREKRGKIMALVAAQAEQPAIEPPKRPSRFVSPLLPTIMRPPVEGQVLPQAPPPQPSGQKLSGQSDADIERELSELEKQQKREALKLRKTPSIEEFEKKGTRTGNEIAVLLSNIDTARKANNGVLTKDQINNFITQLEGVMNRYNQNFAKLSDRSQVIMEGSREELFDNLNKVRQQLTAELRGETPAIMPPVPSTPPERKPKKVIVPLKWRPRAKGGLPLLQEYIRADLDKVNITPEQANQLEAALTTIPEITEVEKLIAEQRREPDPKKRQLNIKEVLEAIKMDKAEEEKLIREATAEERQATKAEQKEEEVDAEKEAERQAAIRNLQRYVTDDPLRLVGYKNWGDKIQAALRLLGMSPSEIARIGALPTTRARKVEVGKFLNMPVCRSGRRSGICVPPAPPASPAPPAQPAPPASIVPMAGRLPIGMRGPAPAKPKMRIIQTENYTEYIRLRNQYAGDPNVFVQAPLSVIQRQTDIDPSDRADLAASRFRIP